MSGKTIRRNESLEHMTKNYTRIKKQYIKNPDSQRVYMELLNEKVQLWLDSARFVKSKPAVFILYDKKLEALYIGHSNNLQEQFTKYLETNFENDECKQKTHTYQKLFVENPDDKSKHLLEEYKEKYGKIPACNDIQKN